MADRAYCRIYFDDLQRDYEAVWFDDEALATFVRLLALADRMWPTRPELPRSTSQEAIDKLTRVGLLVVLPRDRFGIKGLDAERTARSTAGAVGAHSRWRSNSSADVDASAMRSASRRHSDPHRSRNAKYENENENENELPPPPAAQGKRSTNSHPRATGTNPRANGSSPRQVRESQKRGPTKLGDIIRQVEGREQ